MGRKIDMIKIEDLTKCQVTFSKRRTSLMKKAREIALFCGVDIALVMFSPSGRVSKYSNPDRIEDVFHRYMQLPVERRVGHIKDLPRKMERISQLQHIKGETHKVQYLDKQIENLELQIKKRSLELQILEAGLRDYEVLTDQEPSLHQLSWCEKNLDNLLQRVIARKNELSNNLLASFGQPNIQQQINSQGFNQMENKHHPTVQFPLHPEQNISENYSVTDQILTQLDPWISPYSTQFRADLLEGLVHQPNENLGFCNNVPNFMNPSTWNVPNPPAIVASGIVLSTNVEANMATMSSKNMQTMLPANVETNMATMLATNIEANMEAMLFTNVEANMEALLSTNVGANMGTMLSTNVEANMETLLPANVEANMGPMLWTDVENSLMLDQPSYKFPDQNNYNASNNVISVPSSETVGMATWSPYNFNDPRVATQTKHGKAPQSNEDEIGTTQFTKMVGQEIGQTSKDCSNNFGVGSAGDGNVVNGENAGRTDFGEMYSTDQVSLQANPQNIEVLQDMVFEDNNVIIKEDADADKTGLMSRVQTTGMWEWEDLLLNDFDPRNL